MTNTVYEPNEKKKENDEYYLFYEMMVQSLKTDNIKEGLNTSLKLLRKYLRCGNIALYRKNENNKYVFKHGDEAKIDILKGLNSIINKVRPLYEQQGMLDINLELSEQMKNLMIIHLTMNEVDCLLAISNIDKTKELEPLFWGRLKETMTIILKRAESYEKNIAAITTDQLTGLDNRNSYEMTLQSLNEKDDNLVVGIFDLFRLKYINDNFGHNLGDKYIKETAKVLARYWPKENVSISKDGTENREQTGHCVYRIGGDEFVLLTKESAKLTEIKAGLAAIEISKLDFFKGLNMPVGINYGIVEHDPNNPYKTTLQKADEIMQQDKTKTYQKYGIDRRR